MSRQPWDGMSVFPADSDLSDFWRVDAGICSLDQLWSILLQIGTKCILVALGSIPFFDTALASDLFDTRSLNHIFIVIIYRMSIQSACISFLGQLACLLAK